MRSELWWILPQFRRAYKARRPVITQKWNANAKTRMYH